MKSLILREHEVHQALRGPVVVVRAVKSVDGDSIRRPDGSYVPLPTCDRVREAHWTGPRSLLRLSPVGSPSDVVACRETWGIHRGLEDAYKLSRRIGIGFVGYRADQGGCPPSLITRWRSPATMPLWAVRLHLRVLSVECKQVQAVTEDEARLAVECEVYEDGQPISGCWWDYQRKCWSGAFPSGAEARGSLRTLIDSRHGPGSWAANPWVFSARLEREGEG